jgi:hypothetical protein
MGSTIPRIQREVPNQSMQIYTVPAQGHFILGVKTKKAQELSNAIGGEQKIGPKGFTLGIKICQNDLAPMWHHFGAKFSWS